MSNVFISWPVVKGRVLDCRQSWPEVKGRMPTCHKSWPVVIGPRPNCPQFWSVVIGQCQVVLVPGQWFRGQIVLSPGQWQRTNFQLSSVLASVGGPTRPSVPQMAEPIPGTWHLAPQPAQTNLVPNLCPGSGRQVAPVIREIGKTTQERRVIALCQ